jgi:hypothetical protein
MDRVERVWVQSNGFSMDSSLGIAIIAFLLGYYIRIALASVLLRGPLDRLTVPSVCCPAQCRGPGLSAKVAPVGRHRSSEAQASAQRL